MTDEPLPSTIAVWTRLVRAASAVQDMVEDSLKREALPPLAWYDALLEIERAGDGIRPLALQARLLLPQYGLSRLIERMVQAGLVRREACDDDGRGQMLHLTGEGRAVRARMWPVYAAALRQAIETRLRPGQSERLAGILGILLDGRPAQ